MLRALIFDVDGTLAETEEIHRNCFNAAFKSAGFAWHWDKQRYAHLLTTTGGKERISRFITEQGESLLSTEEIAGLHLTKNRFYAETLASGRLALRPGVARVIEEAKAAGLKIGIATTTSRSNLLALLQCCFGHDHEAIFDATVCGEDVQRKKPDSEVYTLCLNRLDVESSAALAFEDSGVGLSAARAADIRTIVIPSAYTQDDDFTGALQTLTDLEAFDIGAVNVTDDI
jgi:HAD superfamily hydrolase (TIGR01509 family)